MENEKIKKDNILGYNTKGEIVKSYKDINYFKAAYGFNTEIAVQYLISAKCTHDGYIWFPSDAYQSEFMKLEEYKNRGGFMMYDMSKNSNSTADAEYNPELSTHKGKEKRTGLGGNDGGKYDSKGNSSHYQAQFMEFIRDQERKYGTVIAMIVCQSNVDKYNQRAGVKEGVPADKDLTKRDWYFKAMTHFKKKIEFIKENPSNNLASIKGRNKYVPVAEEVLDAFRGEFNFEDEEYIPLSVAIEQ